MTILPRKTNFLAGTISGASEGWRQGMEWQAFDKAYQEFLTSYQQRQPGGGGTGGAGIGGATQPNPQAVFGEPGQNQMMGGGMGAPQHQQQNPMMQRLTQMLGGAGRGIGGGLQGLGRGIGGIGQNLGGMLGLNRSPQPAGGMPTGGVNPLAAMMGGGQMGPLAGGGQGGLDPRMLAMLRQLLGGGSGGLVSQGLLR